MAVDGLVEAEAQEGTNVVGSAARGANQDVVDGIIPGVIQDKTNMHETQQPAVGRGP